MTVGFAGLTHLGLVSATALANNGFSVVAYDPDRTRIYTLKSGKFEIEEPNLGELIAKNISRIQYSDEIADLGVCDVVFISSDVPTDSRGTSDLSEISELIIDVSKNLSSHALLVVLCQVPPGFTREIEFPKERLFYQVETLVFGNAVERAVHPERIIVGCTSPRSKLPDNYSDLLSSFTCPILTMGYESAELTKIAINMCLVAAVSTTNMLAEICENIGADWSEIVPALQLDARIGPMSYLKPGLGIAGGNLERDLATVAALSAKYQTNSVVSAWVANSEHRRNWVFSILKQENLLVSKSTVIGLLGLAYKENTHSTKNSPSLALIESLKNFHVQVHDPVVLKIEQSKHVRRVSSPSDVAIDADAVVIMTPWKNYKSLSLTNLARQMKGHLLIDPFGVFNAAEANSAGFDYFTLGVPAARRQKLI